MEPWLGQPANPMSMHREGREAAAALDRARALVAAACGWQREEVFFTSGATEANNWVLHTGRWAASAVEHPSVRAFAAVTLPVNSAGVADPVLAPDLTGIDGISVMLANNETGVLQPVEEWARFCAQRGLLLHVDAAQAPGRVPIQVQADFMTLSAHKAGGPAGVGALLARKGRWPEALLRGGPQERARRAGTHHLAGIVGFGAVMGEGIQSPNLRDALEGRLKRLGGRVAGEGAARLPNTCCIVFSAIDAQDLVVALDLAGIAVSAGSACASGSPEPSHVLKAMKFAGSAVRFSFGETNTMEEVERVGETMERILSQWE